MGLRIQKWNWWYFKSFRWRWNHNFQPISLQYLRTLRQSGVVNHLSALVLSDVLTLVSLYGLLEVELSVLLLFFQLSVYWPSHLVRLADAIWLPLLFFFINLFFFLFRSVGHDVFNAVDIMMLFRWLLLKRDCKWTWLVFMRSCFLKCLKEVVNRKQVAKIFTFIVT
jgi:hypothetical protein